MKQSMQRGDLGYAACRGVDVRAPIYAGYASTMTTKQQDVRGYERRKKMLLPPERASKLEFIVMVALIVMDIGWVARIPSIGLVAAVTSLCLQLMLVLLALQGSSSNKMHHFVILAWIIGNLSWMCGEYLWEKEPVGMFVSFVPYFTDQKPLWLSRVLCFSSAVMIFNSVMLSSFYVLQLATGKQMQLRREIRGARAVINVPTLMHQDLYVFPWLLSDSCWALANHSSVIGQPCRSFTSIGITLGVCAVSLCGMELRRQAATMPWHEVNHIAAEFTWVFGNVVWFAADTFEFDNSFERCVVVFTFLVGLIMLLGCELRAQSSEDEASHGSTDRLLPPATCRPEPTPL